MGKDEKYSVRSVRMSEDVDNAIIERIEKGEFDNYSQAVRRAIRIAFIEKKRGDCNVVNSSDHNKDPEPTPVA